MAFVKVKESARQSDDGYKCQKPDHFHSWSRKTKPPNQNIIDRRFGTWTRTIAMSDTGEAIDFAYLRNDTRLLSLMSRMRVKSGTGCDGIAQEHGAPTKVGLGRLALNPPVGAECSSVVAALHVCVSVDGGVLDVSQPNQLLIAADMGANVQRTPRGILPSRPPASPPCGSTIPAMSAPKGCRVDRD